MLIDEVKLEAELNEQVKSITKEFVVLENGAEGYLFRMSDEHLANSPAKGENGKFPMCTIIHGGPFSASP